MFFFQGIILYSILCCWLIGSGNLVKIGMEIGNWRETQREMKLEKFVAPTF
jgi:hypothetical protein